MPSPDKSVAIVARADGKRIVGRLFIVAPAHCEGIFVEPAFRGGPLFKDMMRAAEVEAKVEGLSKLFAYSVRPEIGHYIQQRCGYTELSWKVFEKELA